MKSLYQSPLRVYLLLALMAGFGLWSANQLSVSLFPQKNQVSLGVSVPYGPLSASEFANTHGQKLESAISGLMVDGFGVKNVVAKYDAKRVRVSVDFEWGVHPEAAKKDFGDLIKTESQSWPEESRDRIWEYSENRNSGFFAAAVYSDNRNPDEIYKESEAIVKQWGASVVDAEGVELWNPKAKAITIELNANALAQTGVSILQVQSALFQELESLSGGTLTKDGTDFSMELEVASSIGSVAELENFVVGRGSQGTDLKLRDLAKVTLGPAPSNQRTFRTSGMDSLILWAEPKPGGNVKKMSEDIKALIAESGGLFAKDVQMKVLVDPSEFINAAIESVFHEVGIASLLAVMVLFFFIGSFKNVATAAIEIPLSLILAFIFMWIFGLNLNLISLGGLALSAGMNVDASVVVMENIFRHFEQNKGLKLAKDRFALLLKAVSEVKLAIIASTISSLVVFLPLIATKGMTNSILGDLAQAVIFSHGLSAFVALILVPTVRWQMMKSEKEFHVRSPIEKQLQWLERTYHRSLTYFLAKPMRALGTFGGLMGLLAVIILFLVPRLEKEVIGQPDTDWVVVGAYSPTSTRHQSAMNLASEVEAKVLGKWQDEILYTFSQVHGTNYAQVLGKLKNKKHITRIKEEMETDFQNTSSVYYTVEAWNPSEMNIPKSYDYKVEFLGGSYEKRVKASSVGSFAIQEAKLAEKIRSEPGLEKGKQGKLEIIPRLFLQGSVTSLRQEVAYLARLATEGIQLKSIEKKDEKVEIHIMFPKGQYSGLSALMALPVRHQNRIVSLGTLVEAKVSEKDPTYIRENGREVVQFKGFFDKKAKLKGTDGQEVILASVKEAVAKDFPKVKVVELDPRPELSEAITQLQMAIMLSVLLIFVTMVLQFNDIVSALLILVAIPLGLVGVFSALYIFKSTLSLNSLLGIILLNGIAVANSIILVDFIRKRAATSGDLQAAAIDAAGTRLRPILMTTLTTSLGMLPIALGMGDGGKVLQPLGIAVVGGLGFSTLTTLYMVPGLQLLYLKWQRRRNSARLLRSMAAGAVREFEDDSAPEESVVGENGNGENRKSNPTPPFEVSGFELANGRRRPQQELE